MTERWSQDEDGDVDLVVYNSSSSSSGGGGALLRL